MPNYPKGIFYDQENNLQTSALFSVMGMTCSACAGSVEKAIKRLPGINEAVVDVLNNRAHVVFYPSFVNEETIRETIEDVGFEATLLEEDRNVNSTQVCRVRIKGMTCTSCSSTIESALKVIPGVQKAQVALATEVAEIHYDQKILNYKKILEKDTGFQAKLISTGEDQSKIQLKVDGITSEDSVRMIVNPLQELPGVEC
ncbi:hypothetical protein LIER_40596 [Lithospermum erythrorhizon]|uniref:HMA domain-containing protein n=1 Tax=Lithospermum erythrorhizon TaxID=34254 RepID=A0AAV3R119_LITER